MPSFNDKVRPTGAGREGGGRGGGGGGGGGEGDGGAKGGVADEEVDITGGILERPMVDDVDPVVRVSPPLESGLELKGIGNLGTAKRNGTGVILPLLV
eukprot:CAMPEP_0175086054 /NCGR_PEP_ID=MMETSP0052_2-20121109/29023_1 /TAXON_ID=51329 ORGANISM="Polytomella parva, Strain SAG 63-3" /NCGR_SAMPLE_ID=MMETSP0052_2 /ASSEMBLY_ACC=CAM_ASM_000194 /LENGTH=97 /DNA_ID=CAMNT_0016358169 /DNA_START=329 /DNA_END=619 /DNA_ORIENTATION=-